MTVTAQDNSDHVSDMDGNAESTSFTPGIVRTKVVPAVAIVMVVGLLALLAYSLFAPENARRVSDARVTPSGLVVYDDPKPAAQFAIETFDGETFNLQDQRGKVVLLNFWGSWCEPCREETPLLVNAAKGFDDDVVLFGVDVWEESDAAPRAFLVEFGVNYPTGRDRDGQMGIDYGITGVPETFVIDAAGNIVAKMPGPVTSLAQINEMIAEAR